MRRIPVLVAVSVLGPSALTACSSGDYCGELTGYVEASKNLDLSDGPAVGRMLDHARRVAKAAPGELKDDWKVVLDYAEKAKAGRPVTGGAERMTGATEAIARQAKSSCQLDIGT